jgi:predicted nucleic acid-binding protein
MTNTSTEKWGIDSNLILYALDKKSPYHKKTKEFFEQILIHKQDLYTAQQNILEVERILTHKYKVQVKRAIKVLTDFLEAFKFNIISPLPTTLMLYHQIIQNCTDQGKRPDIFDIYLASTLLDNNIGNLYTLNTKDFVKIKNFEVKNPIG